MQKTVSRGVPKHIYIIILVILAAMFSYATYFDLPAPEKTVEKFYQAYFQHDYESVAKYASVFWAVQFLPEYHDMSPAELINNRPKVEEAFAKIMAEIEKDTEYPPDLHVDIDSTLTKIGERSAIVGYTFREGEQTFDMAAAILFHENGAYRVFNMVPASPQDIQNITPENMQLLDNDFKSLLEME